MVDWQATPESSHVEAIGYEQEFGNLYVRFNDGSEYRYKSVEQPVWEEFQQSGSKGRYVGIVLKRRYRYERLN